MNTLKILDWGKLKREVDFIGYSTDHMICYIYDENRWAAGEIDLRLEF
jgi:hypothetical protein